MNPEEQQFIGPQLPPVQGPQLPTRTITSDQAANNLFTQDAFYRIKDPVGVDNSDVFGVEQPTAPQVDTQLQGAQQFLNQAGFNAGPVDGIYGPKTQAGLTAFQQAQGIPTTGQLDDATRQAMTSFQFEPMPTPTIPKEVDITQIEGERPPRMEIPQQPDPFQSMIEGAAARSQQVMTQLSDQLKSQQEAVGGLEAQILQVLQEPGQRTLEEQLLKQSNVQQYQQELNQIYGRMQMLDVDLQRQKNTLERQGAVRSTEGFNRRQREAAQDIATEQMALMAQAQVLQGNIKLAQDYAKMAAETQAEQRMSQLEQLGLLYDNALRQAEATNDTLAIERAAALKFQNDLALSQLENQLAQYNAGVQIATEAINRGADPKEVADFIEFARVNPGQAQSRAMELFGKALQQPTAQEKLDMDLTRARIATEQQQTAKIADERRIANTKAQTLEDVMQNNSNAFTRVGLDLGSIARRAVMGLGGTGSERELISQDIMTSQDPLGEIETVGVAKLPNAEAEEYRNVYASVIPQLQSAVSILESDPDIGLGNINKILRNAKKKFGSQDPRYEQIVFLLEGVNAPIRNAIFGASLTEGEERKANEFLIDTADTGEVILNKSRGLMATQDFAAERAALQAAGLTQNEIQALEDAGEIFSFEDYQSFYGVDPSFISGSPQQTRTSQTSTINLGGQTFTINFAE